MQFVVVMSLEQHYALVGFIDLTMMDMHCIMPTNCSISDLNSTVQVLEPSKIFRVE